MDRAIPEPDAEAIRQSIFAGRKIEAIKRLRESTNLDLAEAKTMVEQLEGELRKSSPEKFTAKPGNGCSTTAAVFVVAITIVWIFVTSH
jgi:hypothetical protein